MAKKARFSVRPARALSALRSEHGLADWTIPRFRRGLHPRRCGRGVKSMSWTTETDTGLGSREVLCPYRSPRSGGVWRCRAEQRRRVPSWTGVLPAKISCRPLPSSARICRKLPSRMPPGPLVASVRQAVDGRLAALVRRLVVEAVGLHVVEAGLRDRDIAGDCRPEERLLGLGDEVEEGGGRLVFLRRDCPSAPTTKRRRRTSCAGRALIDRQHGDVPMHVGRSGAADVAVVAD